MCVSLCVCVFVNTTQGQLFWSEQVVRAAGEWTEGGGRLSSLGQAAGRKAESHEHNTMAYVDDQVRTGREGGDEVVWRCGVVYESVCSLCVCRVHWCSWKSRSLSCASS
jgi:hypothetical protein